MKKIVCLLTVLLLCMSLVVPAFAAEDDFVPSITYKPSPEIIPVEDAEDEGVIGVINGADGEVLDNVDEGCLMVTPIAHVWDEDIDVAEHIEDVLIIAYNGLNDGTMEIPYEKFGVELEGYNMVIRDLFDVRWACEEHGKMMEQEGATFQVTFDLGVVADAQIFAMTYDEETKEWSPIVSVVNNGDGTVTCTFAHFCPVAFCMPVAVAPVDDVQTSVNLLPWCIIFALAVIAVVVILIAKKKKKAAV